MGGQQTGEVTCELICEEGATQLDSSHAGNGADLTPISISTACKNAKN